MAERLTKKISKTIQDKYSLGSYLYYDFAEIDDTNKLLNKLGKLEDILEKYGFESLDTLEHIIKKGQVINTTIEGFAKEAYDEMQTDRDYWKRACELACKHIAEVEWFSCPETDDISESENEIKTLTKQSLNFFYQQAKKEGDNNDTNK